MLLSNQAKQWSDCINTLKLCGVFKMEIIEALQIYIPDRRHVIVPCFILLNSSILQE